MMRYVLDGDSVFSGGERWYSAVAAEPGEVGREEVEPKILDSAQLDQALVHRVGWEDAWHAAGLRGGLSWETSGRSVGLNDRQSQKAALGENEEGGLPFPQNFRGS